MFVLRLCHFIILLEVDELLLLFVYAVLEIHFIGSIPYESPDEKIIWKWTQNGSDKSILIPIVYLDMDETPPSMKKTVLQLGTPSAGFEGD